MSLIVKFYQVQHDYNERAISKHLLYHCSTLNTPDTFVAPWTSSANTYCTTAPDTHNIDVAVTLVHWVKGLTTPRALRVTRGFLMKAKGSKAAPALSFSNSSGASIVTITVRTCWAVTGKESCACSDCRKDTCWCWCWCWCTCDKDWGRGF